MVQILVQYFLPFEILTLKSQIQIVVCHSLACLASNLPAMIWTQCAEISSDNLKLDWKLYQPLVEQTLRNAFSAPKRLYYGANHKR